MVALDKTLATGKNLRLELRPDLGGAIGGVWLDNVPILRPTPIDATSSRETACFPMIPYSGRLGFCRFNWRGVDYTTQPNFEDSPHSLHGVGWQRAWRMVALQPQQAVMSYTHPGDKDWPFAFIAYQEFTLNENGLLVKLVVRSLDKRPQPMGLGFHPYFCRDDASAIFTGVTEKWETDQVLLPTRAVPLERINGLVANLDYDHCFGGWNGGVTITQKDLRIGLSSDLGYVVVYTPPQKDYFCVEPVTHRTNALNSPDPLSYGVCELDPGEELTANMYLEFS
ncbi:MAG: aldose 1-epimerase [Candidatus Symbiobacter sp.]|nr:aldose 1-epimerase [Candidatus Symbiobacter sp.]